MQRLLFALLPCCNDTENDAQHTINIILTTRLDSVITSLFPTSVCYRCFIAAGPGLKGLMAADRIFDDEGGA